MRWTLRRQVRASAPDENAAAYGEVVWSWRRDPGATLAETFPLATGARKAASPGRARISRKTIARGRPGCPGCTCQIRVRSYYFLHTVLRAQSAPGFPCALSSERGNEMQNSGEKPAPRSLRRAYFLRIADPSRRRARARLLRMRAEQAA